MQFGYRLEFLKSNFFDRPKVMNSLTPVVRKALGRFGGLVRLIARRSIRNGKGVSRPGQPPFNHTRRLKTGILYALDPIRSSVISGPILFNQPMGPLEHGGMADITVSYSRRKKQTKRLYIRARPFMQPAFDRAVQDLPKIWREARQ